MTRLRALNIAISADGFMAGPDQSLEAPLGVGGQQLHQWAFATAWFQRMHGGEASDEAAGEEGVDDEFIRRGIDGIGATVMGRNMFGPVRGEWDSWGPEPWNGWWGAEPPYHHPVFVLTHRARPPLEMIGTTFHFVTDGIESALEQAQAAAGGLDVRLGGGASVINQYLAAGLLDELHLAIVPVLLGAGERVIDTAGPDGVAGMKCVEFVSSAAVTHVRFERITRHTNG